MPYTTDMAHGNSDQKRAQRLYSKAQYALVAHVFKTPAEYADYLDSLGKRRTCDRCNGDGVRPGSWGHHDCNGKYGACFKCGGTGRCKTPTLNKRELAKVLSARFLSQQNAGSAQPDEPGFDDSTTTEDDVARTPQEQAIDRMEQAADEADTDLHARVASTAPACDFMKIEFEPLGGSVTTAQRTYQWWMDGGWHVVSTGGALDAFARFRCDDQFRTVERVLQAIAKYELA